jgi:hypothetical protein
MVVAEVHGSGTTLEQVAAKHSVTKAALRYYLYAVRRATAKGATAPRSNFEMATFACCSNLQVRRSIGLLRHASETECDRKPKRYANTKNCYRLPKPGEFGAGNWS